MRIAKAGSDNVDLGKDGCNRWCQNTGIAKKGGESSDPAKVSANLS